MSKTPLLLSVLCTCFLSTARAIPVGAAKVDITPDYPTLLAGYGSRNQPSEGVAERIWARALVFGDTPAAVVIAVDNCGVPQASSDRVAAALETSHGVPRERIVVLSTHTHNAPNLTGYAVVLWAGRAAAQEFETMHRYTRWLEQRLVEVATKALDTRSAGKLAWGQGRVAFGGNRRVLNEDGWQGFGFQIDKPVDHSMPLLLATAEDGKPIATWCNYACHCTTLGSHNHISGDWAGFANAAVEDRHPDAIALTTIGCGADVGPQPSGTAANARAHGQAIAREVQRLIGKDKDNLTPLTHAVRSATKTVQLPFAAIPERTAWQEKATAGGFDGEHARRQLARLDRGESLRTHLPYAITTWNFGSELGIVFLPGEVCVDYALRLKTELDWRRLWINGWANDVPCYIPSKRILAEGGYEADFSMIYYDQPTRFAPQVEDTIVTGVRELLGGTFDAAPDAKVAPFFLHPLVTGESSEPPPTIGAADKEAIRAQLAKFSGLLTSDRRAELTALFQNAREGFARSARTSKQSYDSWHTFTGARRLRPYIRQTTAHTDRGLVWETPDLHIDDPLVGSRSLVFAGGLGWMTEPQTEGFVLEINGKPRVHFDVTREPQTWVGMGEGDEGEVRLLYLPTWTSDVDSSGFFFLTASNQFLHNPDGPTTLSVRSVGEASLRWFALDRLPACRPYLATVLECFPGD